MRSLLHTIEVMGVDHVGLGADWDGGGGVIGMDDITALPRITARLRREGLSDVDIAKIMGGNLMRGAPQAGRRPALTGLLPRVRPIVGLDDLPLVQRSGNGLGSPRAGMCVLELALHEY